MKGGNMYVFRLLPIQNPIKGVWFEVANNEEKSFVAVQGCQTITAQLRSRTNSWYKNSNDLTFNII